MFRLGEGEEEWEREREWGEGRREGKGGWEEEATYGRSLYT